MADAPNVIRWEPDIAPLKAAYDELNAKEKKRQELVTTGGKNLAKVWEQQQKAAERAAKGPSEWTLALKANTEQVANQRAELNKSKEAMGALGNAIGLIDPRLQTIAGGLQKITGAASAATAAGELVGASLGTVAAVAGPLAAVVGTVGVAWHVYSERAKEAQEAQDRLSASLDEINPIAARARDEIDKLKLNLGQYTQAEYDENEIRKEFARNLENTTAKWEEERVAVEENMATIGTANAEYLKQQDRLHELNDLIERSTTLSEQGREAAIQNLEFTRETAAAEANAAARIKERTATTKDATAAEKDRAARNQRDLDAMKELRELEERRFADSAAFWAAEEERAAKKRAEDEAQLKALQDFWALAAEIDKKANATIISNAEKTVSAVGSIFGSAGDIYDTFLEGAEEAAENGSKAEQQAYIKQWYASQALKEAEVAANTIVGISAAAASAPPPLNLIPIAAATATGIAQEVAIAAVPPPTFEDTPGPVIAPVQNYQPTFKRQDIIIAAQTPQEVQRQAASLGGDGGRWSKPSTAKQLAQTNVGWMLGQQLRLTVRGQQDRR